MVMGVGFRVSDDAGGGNDDCDGDDDGAAAVGCTTDYALVPVDSSLRHVRLSHRMQIASPRNQRKHRKFRCFRNVLCKPGSPKHCLFDV